MSSSDPTAKPYHGGYASPGGNQGLTSNGNAPAPTTYGYTVASSSGAGGYTIGVGLNGISAGDLTIPTNLLISSDDPVMKWGSMEDGIDITFFESENGVRVKAKLAVAYDATPRESLYINLLITAISTARATMTRPLTFIRRHGLERHFDISLA